MSEPLDRERWKRVEELFQEALEREPADHRAFLEAECGDDDELKAEVESLLAGADTELAGALAAVHRVADQVTESSAATAVGRRLGPYRLEREIGRGGMGVVYLGVREDDEFEQNVAIKVLPGALFSGDTLTRFKNERRILASLDHPNIARLLDGGTTSEGLPYVIMELVDGMPIDRHCEDEALDVDARIWLFLAVCSAVQYAHQHLIVHRDLKPSNILVTEDGRPKLLDFGIAKLVTPEDEEAAARTATRIMTPRFASPEQLRGERIGTPSDVYSLGLILYRLLAGQLPYKAEDSTPADLIRWIEEQDPAPPSVVASNRKLAGDLDTIVLTALRREPERRYDSVGSLAEDLKRYLTGQPIAARPATWGYRARKFVRRNRGGVAAAAGVVLLLVGFGVAMAIQADRVAAQRDFAERARLQAERTSDFLVNLFYEADPNQTGGAELSALDLLGLGAVQAREELAEEPEVQAAVMDMIGRVYRTMADYDRAYTLLEEARQIRFRTLGPRHDDYLESLLSLGFLERRRGNNEQAVRLYEEVVAGRRALYGDAHESIALVLNNLGVAKQALGQTAVAESLFRESIAIWDELGSEDPNALLPVTGLGAMLSRRGAVDSAAVLFRRNLDRQRELHGGDHEDVATSLNNLASILQRSRRFEESRSMFEESIAMRERLFGWDHPRTLVARNNLALLLKDLGEHEEAVDRLADVVAARRERDELQPLAIDLNNYATVLQSAGHLEEWATYKREALAVAREAFGPSHPRVAAPLTGVAQVLVFEGDTAAATPLLREALALRIAAYGETHPRVALSYHELGRNLSLRGLHVEADSVLTQALTIREAVLDPGNLDIAAALVDLGASRLELGDRQGCASLARRALELRRAKLEPEDGAITEAERVLERCLADADAGT